MIWSARMHIEQQAKQTANFRPDAPRHDLHAIPNTSDWLASCKAVPSGPDKSDCTSLISDIGLSAFVPVLPCQQGYAVRDNNG
jgi:hypothetical protein